jgi:hypothetical protein
MFAAIRPMLTAESRQITRVLGGVTRSEPGSMSFYPKDCDQVECTVSLSFRLPLGLKAAPGG